MHLMLYRYLKKPKFWLFLFALVYGMNLAMAQQPAISSEERNRIVNETYNFVKLYNSYHSCVQDAGHFSEMTANQFKELFRQDAVVVQDLNDGQRIPKSGVFPEEYVRNLKQFFPDGLTDASFTIVTINPVRKSNKSLRIEVSGKKSFKGYDRNGRFINKADYDFIIDLESDPDLSKIKIAGTKLPGWIPGTPPNPNDYVVIKAKITGQDMKPIVGARVYLMKNDEAVDSLVSSSEGRVSFEKVLKNNSYKLYAEKDSLKAYSQQFLADSFKNKDLSVELRSSVITKVTVLDQLTKRPLKDVRINVKTDSWSKTYWTNERGMAHIEIIGNRDNLRLTSEKEDYDKVIKESIPQRILMKPLDQYYLSLMAYSGLPFLSVSKTKYIPEDHLLNGKPTLGVECGYHYYPSRLNMKFFRAGFFGKAAIEKWNIPTDSISIVTMTDKERKDIDGDIYNLNAKAINVFERYTVNSIKLSGGPEMKFTHNAMSLVLGAGPMVMVYAGGKSDFAVQNLRTSGVYPGYWNRELEEIERYGFRDYSSDEIKTVPMKFKMLNFGITAGLNFSYFGIGSKDYGLTAGIQYDAVLNNMLPTNRTDHFIDFKYDMEENPEEVSYSGLLNLYDSFKVSTVSFKVGLLFKTKR